MTEPKKPPAPDVIPVRAPDGSVGTVDKAHLAEAIEAGAQVVDQATLQKAEVQAKYGGAGGTALAAGAGVARGLTLGLSDVAAAGIGGEGVRQDLEGLKEANPYASIGGEVVGAIAPAFLTGGASTAAEGLTLGKAVRGLGALPRAVGSLGMAAERGVAGVVGEGLVGRIAGKAAAGALEGSIYSAGSAASEAALGDHELTAESLLGSMKHGAIAGGLLGGAAGLFSRGAARAQDIEAVAARQLGDATPGLGKAVREASAADGAIESYISKVADSPEQAELLANAWRRREQMFGKHEETLEEATRKVTSHLDDAIKAERAVDMVSFGEAKAGQMAKLVNPENVRGARDVAMNVYQDARATLEMLQADAAKGGAGIAVGKAAKQLQSFGQELEAILKPGTRAGERAGGNVSAELFSKLDDFKRAVGQGAQFGKGPFGMTEAAKEFDALYHRVRGALENEEVWGKAAVAQREINEATAARLSTRREFGSTFTKEYGSEMGRPTYVANPEGAATYVRSLTSAKNDLKHRAIQDYISNEEKFLDAVERNYAVAPGEKAQIAKAREAFAGLRSTIDGTAKEITTVNQLKRLKAEEQAGGIGGLLGLATDTATRPLRTLERLAEIEKATKNIDNTLRKGVKAFFGREAPLPPAPSGESAVAEYARVSKNVKDVLAGDGGASNIARTTEGIVDVAPNAAAHMSSVATRAATFLASKLPPEHVDPNSLTPHLEKPRVSDADRDKFLRYARATNDPRTVADDLGAGRLTREAVEAYQTVYPKMYEKNRLMVKDHLENLKEPLPYSKELQLRIFLGNPTFDAALLKAIQGNFAEQREAKQQRSAASVPFKLTNDIRSASERVETR